MTAPRAPLPASPARLPTLLAGALLLLGVAACQGGATTPAAAVASAAPIPPDRLMGLDEGGVTALLGTPDLARSEADIRILQYRATGCVADIYLYPAEGGGRSVTYTEARTTNGGGTDQAGCLGAIAAGR